MGERPFFELADEELFAELAKQNALLAQVEARFLDLAREVDRRVELAPVLRAMRVERPEAVVRTARMLGDLPELNKAFAAGEVNRAHVRIAVRSVREVGKVNPGATDDVGLAKIDSVFVDAARDLAPREFQAVANHLRATLDPDGGDTIDPRQLDRRELLIWDDPSGMVGVKGFLDPATGMWFKAAVDRFSRPDPAAHPDQEALPKVRDVRSQAQRQADALQELSRIALGARRDPDRPHLVIHTRADANTSGLSQAWIGRLLCDAEIALLTKGRNDEVLELGHTVRLATATQRRALIGRDKTCVIPKCTVPAKWCDAHHVQWSSKGGPTNVTNLAMACGRHHTEIHADVWTVEMRDGIPWVKPPKWLDPQQRWHRNDYTHHQEAAEQLAIELSPRPDDVG